ncbi:MAG: type 4a pilus biogenesis protein PilO [Candidatus Woesebacteria bacterium]|jgi:Tfp pilus assembly protein PilO
MVKKLKNKYLAGNLSGYRYQLSWIAAFASILASIFLFKTAYLRVDDLLARKNQLKHLQEELALLDSNLANWDSQSESIDLVYDSLPQDYEEVAEFMYKLEAIASNEGQTLENEIDMLPNDESAGLKALEITVVADGTYSGFSNFAGGIANLPYHLRMNSLSMKQAEGSVESTLVFEIFMR